MFDEIFFIVRFAVIDDFCSTITILVCFAYRVQLHQRWCVIYCDRRSFSSCLEWSYWTPYTHTCTQMFPLHQLYCRPMKIGVSGEQMEVDCLISPQHLNQLYLTIDHLNLDILFCFPAILPRKLHIKQALLHDVQLPTVLSLLLLTNKLLTQFFAQQPLMSSFLNATHISEVLGIVHCRFVT